MSTMPIDLEILDLKIKSAEIFNPSHPQHIRLSNNGLSYKGLVEYEFFVTDVTLVDDGSKRTVIVRRNPKKNPEKLDVCFIVNISYGGYNPEKFGVSEARFREETEWTKEEDWEVVKSNWPVNLFSRTESFFVIPAIQLLLSGEDCDVGLHWIDISDFRKSSYYVHDYDGCESILDEEPSFY